MPFKMRFGPQNMPLSKQPFKAQSQIENEDSLESPQYDMILTHWSYENILVEFHSSLEIGDSRVERVPPFASSLPPMSLNL